MKCWVVLVYVENSISGSPAYENVCAYPTEQEANDIACIFVDEYDYLVSIHEMVEWQPYMSELGGF